MTSLNEDNYDEVNATLRQMAMEDSGSLLAFEEPKRPIIIASGEDCQVVLFNKNNKALYRDE